MEQTNDTLFYIILLMACLLMFGMTACFYQVIKNIMEMILGEKKNKWMKMLLIIACFGIILFFVLVWNLGLLVLLHFMGFVFVFWLIDFVVKRIAKEKYENLKIWGKLVKCYILPILATIFVMGYGYWNMHYVVETNYVLTTQKDIREEGYRVALLADIHFGVSIDIEEMKEVCEKIERQEPDIVVLCGDIMDEKTTYDDMEQLLQVLGDIKSTYGTYYVYGNHDRQNYSSHPTFTNQDILRNLSENGITLLQDEKIQITDDLVLVGREDASVIERKPLADLYKEIDKQDFILTLDHQPLEYTINEELGTDLLLSGHTHAGQFFPLNLIMNVIPFGDAVYGETKSGSFTGFVTSGVAGWSFPIKTSASAEYVMIEIKK